MAVRTQTPWQRRFRRLLFLAGTVSAVYFASSYMMDRMREGAVRAAKEKRRLDLLKSHFTSLLSTLSFTLYALLPTLSPQLAERYPVERISTALQGMSHPTSSQCSIAPPTPDATLSSDPARHGHPGSGEEGSLGDDGSPRAPAPAPTEGSPGIGGAGQPGVGESWASEFSRRPSEAMSSASATSEVMSVPETDDISSVASQTISLPPTDVSSASGSPQSDVSHHAHLHPSPPRPAAASTSSGALETPNWEGKSKKELWRDLKVQSVTRALTTAYLLPLLYVLTASQLSTLARERYLHDLAASLPPIPAPVPASRARSSSAKRGWFFGLSIEALGLSEFVDETSSLLPSPTSFLPGIITSRLPGWLVSPSRLPATAGGGSEGQDNQNAIDEGIDRAEAERLYLTYSWWILHEGWKGVADRVESAVESVFGSMALKRDLQLSDWDSRIREVRLRVDLEDGVPVSWTNYLLPPDPLLSTRPDCPLPSAPPSPHLRNLLEQTREHLESPDARYLLTRGVDAMVKHLLGSLSAECYSAKPRSTSRFLESIPTVANVSAEGGRRLVDCLPEISRWGKGVWEGVPDGGVEALIALPEFESFAALIFGDWASR